MSNWTHHSGDFSKNISSGEIVRQEIYRNARGTISELKFLETTFYPFFVEIKLFNAGVDVKPLFERLRSEIPGIDCVHLSTVNVVFIRLLSPIQVTQQNKLKILEAINSFEPIEPLSTFMEMKKSLGIDLTDSIYSYQAQIQTLYTDGKFDAALTLALRCKEAGMPGLVHGLAQRCLEVNDYENLIKAIPYESDTASIYEFAFQLFTAVEVDGVTSGRDKLKIAMKLFDLCGSLNDALTLKAQIFAELTGKSFDETFVDLATHLHGDNLCQVANVLFEMNKLKAVSGSSSRHAGSSTVVRGFSGGASGGSKFDASTQTDEDGSVPK